MARRVLIAGASSTLGQAIAHCLDSKQYQLWLTARSTQKLGELPRQFPNARVQQVDVTRPEDVQALRAEIKSNWNGLDGLVCAFGSGALKPVQAWTDQSSAEMLQLNVEALLRIGREFFPLLLKGEQPAVVLLSSIAGLLGAPGMSVYGAAKAAVANLARAWAIEWAPRRIRVNAVAPGLIPSPLSDTILGSLEPEQLAAVRSRYPLGFGQPEDVGEAVAFLLGQQSKWITGVVLPVDGGYSAQ